MYMYNITLQSKKGIHKQVKSLSLRHQEIEDEKDGENLSHAQVHYITVVCVDFYRLNYYTKSGVR